MRAALRRLGEWLTSCRSSIPTYSRRHRSHRCVEGRTDHGDWHVCRCGDAWLDMRVR